jgi:hypothetical protein
VHLPHISLVQAELRLLSTTHDWRARCRLRMQSESGVASFVDAPIFVGVYRYRRVELARKQALFWRGCTRLRWSASNWSHRSCNPNKLSAYACPSTLATTPTCKPPASCHPTIWYSIRLLGSIACFAYSYRLYNCTASASLLFVQPWPEAWSFANQESNSRQKLRRDV